MPSSLLWRETAGARIDDSDKREVGVGGKALLGAATDSPPALFRSKEPHLPWVHTSCPRYIGGRDGKVWWYRLGGRSGDRFILLTKVYFCFNAFKEMVEWIIKGLK